MDTEVKVSVICCAYNQEKYIEDALKGFTCQNTDFAYEVLISDDASTDRTAEIIKKYEREFPEIIKPLYLHENMYSKGVYPGILLAKKAKGQYIALCEGDDYWISRDKLQKQYDALEAHPECDMCAHSAYRIRPYDKKPIGVIDAMGYDGLLTMEDVIDGGGDFIATNSLFYRRSMLENPAQYLRNYYIDYAIQMNGAQRGGIVYLHDVMSAYRRGADNSWTVKMAGDKDRMLRHIDRMERMLDLVDQETQSKYSDHVAFAKEKYEFLKASMTGDRKAVSSRRYLDLRREMGAKKRGVLFLNMYLPGSIRVYQRAKRLCSSVL